MRRLVVLGLTLVLLMSLVGAANALVVTVYTNKTAWENASAGQFLTEGFEDNILNPGVTLDSEESGQINTAGDYYQDVLKSGSGNAPLTTWSFTPQITGYGGEWTLAGGGGSGNSLLIFVNDLNHQVGTIGSSYAGGFWGFTSDTPFASVLLKGGDGSQQQMYQLDNMVYSQVPVPGTLWLVSGGLMGLLALRRHFL